jgi:hypothetical protein
MLRRPPGEGETAGKVERAGRVREGSRPARVWCYSETVKPCSVPYLMLASCQLFSPSLRGVSET